MENTKVEVKINNMEYTVVSNETEEYVQRVALLVNKKIAEVKGQNSRLSTAMLAVMAAMNLADELIKSDMAVDNLRGEMSTYMDEAQKSGAELENKKLEVENLKEELHKLEIELAKRETELENLRTSAPTQKAGSSYTARSYAQPRSTAPVSGQTSIDSIDAKPENRTVQSGAGQMGVNRLSGVNYTSAASDRFRKK